MQTEGHEVYYNTSPAHAVDVTFDDETEFIDRFQRGDESVFDEFVRRYYDRTYRLAQRMVPNPDDAIDITQEAFLRAYQGLKTFKQACRFYSWLYRITVNLCIDFIRRSATRERVTYNSTSADDLMKTIPDGRFPSPAKQTENRELSIHIRNAIMQLPPKQREVFILRHGEGLSLKEIAHTMDRSIGTVKAHLFQARGQLQSEIRPYLQ